MYVSTKSTRSKSHPIKYGLIDSFAPDAGSAVDVIPPPADESTVSPDDEQAAASDSRAGEVSGPPSEVRLRGNGDIIARSVELPALLLRPRRALPVDMNDVLVRHSQTRLLVRMKSGEFCGRVDCS